MPNTLVHLGINGLVTRTLIKKSDLFLIYIGSVIPDFPWIIQRLVSWLNPNVNNYDLRLYSIVLASLLFSIILSFGLANLFINSKRTFIIFSAGSLIHLLLDSFETKWGNGVHFFSPFTWELVNFRFFWPEDIIIYCATGFGLLFMVLNWRETLSTSITFSNKVQKNILVFIFCIIIYFFLPLLFMNSAESVDNHFVKTLRNEEYRIGKYFETDRGFFINSPVRDKFRTPFDEELKVANLNLSSSEKMSIRAKFISKDEIQIIEYHIHHNRDLFSYAGLFLLLILFITSMFKTDRLKIRS